MKQLYSKKNAMLPLLKIRSFSRKSVNNENLKH